MALNFTNEACSLNSIVRCLGFTIARGFPINLVELKLVGEAPHRTENFSERATITRVFIDKEGKVHLLRIDVSFQSALNLSKLIRLLNYYWFDLTILLIEFPAFL